MEIRKHRPTIQLLAAVFLIVVGCGLLIAGFVVPPPGEIHNSVLIAFGEILTFAGAVFGLKYHYEYGSGCHHENSSQSSTHNTSTQNADNP